MEFNKVQVFDFRFRFRFGMGKQDIGLGETFLTIPLDKTLF